MAYRKLTGESVTTLYQLVSELASGKCQHVAEIILHPQQVIARLGSFARAAPLADAQHQAAQWAVPLAPPSGNVGGQQLIIEGKDALDAAGDARRDAALHDGLEVA